MISERVQADFLGPAVLQDTSAYWVQELADQTPDGELPPWARVQEEIEHLLEQFLTLLTTPVVLSKCCMSATMQFQSATQRRGGPC